MIGQLPDTYNNNPLMALVKQELYFKKINNIPRAVFNTLNMLSIENNTQAGQKVALGVGSRGISNLKEIVKSCVNYLKDIGLSPFIIPAMGSHGGATKEGQIEVLKKLGITETYVNAEINAEMNVRNIGELERGVPIFFSEQALIADHIVIINRVKPHTKFSAPIESGICKMLTIGMGKKEGASAYHTASINHSFSIIEKGAKYILNKVPVLFALSILEDGYKNVASIEAIRPQEIIQREIILLKEAYKNLPKLPFDNIDILIIDYIGKDISGIGMDSNVTGRHRDIVGDFNNRPHIKRIFVRDLTRSTQGNANGIGLADFTTARCVKKIDLNKTYINALTALSPEKAAIPMYFNTDRECLEACIKTIGLRSIINAKIVRIKDTASLNLFQASKTLINEISLNSQLNINGKFKALFTDDNQMIDL